MPVGKKRPGSAGASSASASSGGAKRIKVGQSRNQQQSAAATAASSPAAAVAVATPPQSSSSTTTAPVPLPASSSRKASVMARFLELLRKPENKTGVSNKTAQEYFHAEKEQLANCINELMAASRLRLFKSETDGSNNLWYTLLDDDVVKKVAGLDTQQRLVLQCVERSGNQGIWTKDIRMQTNIQQQALNKIFRTLEQRRLIKPVKSVTAKAKKLYMMYDFTPSKELTGGVWYSGLEFDHEFIEQLRTFIMHVVQKVNKGHGVTLDKIQRIITDKKVSKVELSKEEVQQVVQTLIYDSKIEEEENIMVDNSSGVQEVVVHYVTARKVQPKHLCEFQWWDALSPDFHFRAITFEDGVQLAPHEPHYHTA